MGNYSYFIMFSTLVVMLATACGDGTLPTQCHLKSDEVSTYECVSAFRYNQDLNCKERVEVADPVLRPKGGPELTGCALNKGVSYQFDYAYYGGWLIQNTSHWTACVEPQDYIADRSPSCEYYR